MAASQEPINLSNPYDPKTKKYLQELQAALEEDLRQEMELHRALHMWLEREKERNEVDKNNARIHTETMRKFWERLEKEAKALSSKSSKSEHVILMDKLIEAKSKITHDIARLQQQTTAHRTQIDLAQNQISQENTAWRERRVEAHAAVRNEYEEIFNGPDVRPEDLIRDVNDNVVTPVQLEQILNRAALPDIETQLTQPDFNRALNDRLIDVEQDTIKLKKIGKPAGEPLSKNDIEEIEAMKAKFLQQRVKGGSVLEQLKILRELSGGLEAEVGSALLLHINRKNRLMGNLIRKMNSPYVILDAESMKKILVSINEINELNEKILVNQNNISQLKEKLDFIDSKIKDIQLQDAAEHGHTPRRGPGR